MLRIFTGFDPREAIGWHVFMASLRATSTNYMVMPPLTGDQRDGTNRFTYQRFLIPQLCGYNGWALWLDGADMMLREDISDLDWRRESSRAVLVAKHDYKTAHPRKYVGTDLEADNHDYPRKNWSSLILWNCSHPSHYMHRQKLAEADGSYLHRFSWLDDSEIGDLPLTWNWLDEYGENPDAKLVHFTTGIPGFTHYATAPHASEWKQYAREVTRGLM